MANPEHLQILQQGIEVWNAWRYQNMDIRLDLTGADLSEATSSNVNLTGVNLARVVLYAANLARVVLSEADLSRANLIHADLTGADLTGANLAQANLAYAHLTDAHLYDANLTGAVLAQAQLAGANLAHANLTGADLTKAQLAGVLFMSADLTGANLAHAHLIGATLTKTILREATLDRAALNEAIFTGANLSRADLTGANLSRADLTEAALSYTILREADLAGANLSQAHLYETVFIDTNLTAVRGLETCRHGGPSTLDHRTLAKSGPLPLAFLRGCGLPDALIDYLPSLLNEPFQFYSCFISYASKDHAFAERLYADLQNKGVRCWFAPEDMKIGDRLRPQIDETIRVYDKLLLVLSKTSVASQWVEQEVETALARERQQGTTILFPVRIDDAVMALETGWPALIRNTRNIGDFRRWKTHDLYQKAFARLLRDLTATAQKPDASA